jgi:hypothetical protein
MSERRRSLEPTAEQRIATLERQVRLLAQDYAEQVYGHRGPVAWDAYNGWTLSVPAGPGKVAVADA